MLRRLIFALALVTLAPVSAGPALAESPAPILPGPRTNAEPPPPAEMRLLDGGDLFDATQAAVLTQRLAQVWTDESLDVLIAVRQAPDHNTPAQTLEDARNIGLPANIGLHARGGMVILLNLDETRCHGQAQLWADAKLQRVLNEEDRAAIFDSVAVSALRRCDLYTATGVALDAVVAVANGDRTPLIARARATFLTVSVGILLASLFLIALVLEQLIVRLRRAQVVRMKAAGIDPTHRFDPNKLR